MTDTWVDALSEEEGTLVWGIQANRWVIELTAIKEEAIEDGDKT